MGTVKELRIDELQTDGGLQLRARINQEHVHRLGEAFADASENVPPIGVLFDSKSYWVWDGNHRILGAQQAGFDTIRCSVEKGTQRDAIIRAAGANHDHGLPRTNADKRHAVAALLADKEWKRRSDRWIAETCRVSRTLVADVRDEMRRQDEARNAKVAKQVQDMVGGSKQVAEKPPADSTRIGRDGKEYTKPVAPEESQPNPLLEELQQLLSDHMQDRIGLSFSDLAFVERVTRRGHLNEGEEVSRAAAVLAEYSEDTGPELMDPDEDEPLGTLEPDEAPQADRVAWAEDRFGWLWDKYRATYGDAAAWCYFSAAWEHFKESAGYE